MPGSADTTQSKLILLFVFDKMEVPISEETIIDMCSMSNNWIPQIDCRPILMSLLDAGFIYKVNAAHTDAHYTITPEGRECLAHFFIRIPSSTRENISEFVKNNKFKYRRKQEYLSDYFKNADGTYTVVIKIVEPTCQVLEIKLNVPSRHTAKWINKQWDEKAPQIYASLYDMLVD